MISRNLLLQILHQAPPEFFNDLERLADFILRKSFASDPTNHPARIIGAMELLGNEIVSPDYKRILLEANDAGQRFAFLLEEFPGDTPTQTTRAASTNKKFPMSSAIVNLAELIVMRKS